MIVTVCPLVKKLALGVTLMVPDPFGTTVRAKLSVGDFENRAEMVGDVVVTLIVNGLVLPNPVPPQRANRFPSCGTAMA